MNLLAVNNFGDTRSGGLAGPAGLFIIVLLCIATVLLIRNMNKHVRRLPDSFTDADQTRREDEIARLESDLQRPAAARSDEDTAATTDPSVDGDRSAASGDGTDAEVSGVPVVDAPQPQRREGNQG